MTLVQLQIDGQRITNLVEYLKLRRRVETVSSTLVQEATDLSTSLLTEEGNLPTTEQLWDRLIARAIKNEAAK